eukprot:8418015-Karenia_brevis.AAC.1
MFSSPPNFADPADAHDDEMFVDAVEDADTAVPDVAEAFVPAASGGDNAGEISVETEGAMQREDEDCIDMLNGYSNDGKTVLASAPEDSPPDLDTIIKIKENLVAL